MCSAMLANRPALWPSGVQQHRPIVPPGRQTRTSSRAAAAWSGANMCPNVDVTTSKLCSSNGSSAASPTTHSMSTPAWDARLRPAANHASVRSQATTSAPRTAAGIATAPPLPAPTSSSRTPDPMPAMPATSRTPAASM